MDWKQKFSEQAIGSSDGRGFDLMDGVIYTANGQQSALGPFFYSNIFTPSTYSPVSCVSHVVSSIVWAYRMIWSSPSVPLLPVRAIGEKLKYYICEGTGDKTSGTVSI